MKKVKIKVSVKSLFEIEKRERNRRKEMKKIVNEFIRKYMKKVNLKDVNIENIYLCEDFRMYQDPLKYLSPLKTLIENNLISDNFNYAIFLKNGKDKEFVWVGMLKGKELKKSLIKGEYNDNNKR